MIGRVSMAVTTRYPTYQTTKTTKLSLLAYSCLVLMGTTPAWGLPSFVLLDETPNATPAPTHVPDMDMPSVDVQSVNQKLAYLQSQSLGQSQPLDTSLNFATFGELSLDSKSTKPISRLETTEPPIGFEMVDKVVQDLTAKLADDKLTAPQDTDSPANIILLDDDKTFIVENDGINPARYLPTPTHLPDTPPAQAFFDDRIDKQPNILQRTYSRLFNDGVLGTPRLSSKIYVNPTTLPTPVTATPTNDDGVLVNMDGQWRYDDGAGTVAYEGSLVRADVSKEPFKNIKIALEEITAESVPSFSSALPRLTETVTNALNAVGYYDSRFRLVNVGGGQIDVLIDSLGEPVKVQSAVFEVRSQNGASAFDDLKKEAQTTLNQPLHHGQYEKLKAQVNQTAVEQGFFEGRWLENSVDVLLPDNTADMSLVYEVGERYAFDDVVFFTVDGETGELTASPDKLPVELGLLQKLLTFQQDTPFDRKKTTQLSADLMATRYFNSVNVETVLPQTPSAESDTVADTPTPPTPDETAVIDTGGEQYFAHIGAIDFSPSQDLLDKLGLVVSKANRLYNAPDDRVLDESKKQSTHLLGRVSDAISGIVKAILPDESADVMPDLPEGVSPPTLAGKKTPEQVFADKKVPLYVFVVADKPKDAQIGLGWGSDTGERLTARFDNNLLNRQGYQAGTQVSWSKIDKSASAYIARPLTHPLNDKLSANAQYREEEIAQTNNAKLSTRTLEAGLTRTKVKADGWNKSYFLRYRKDELTSNAPRTTWQDLPVQFSAGTPTQQATLVGVSLNKSIADNFTAPTRGYRQTYLLEMGSAKLASDTDIIIAKAGFGGMASFGDNVYGKARAHQLIGRLDLGYLWAKDFERVPYKLRFFAGGDQSVRGYNYQSLSPVNQAGYLMGGQALAVGSLEYNYELKEGLRLAMFGDVGNAYDKDFGHDTKFGVGVGVRFASPVGTVRVDIAKGIEQEKTPIRLHFLIGLPF